VNVDKIRTSEKGFTLVEVLISAVILVFVFSGILLSFVRCLELSEMSRNTSNALAAVKNHVEDIKNTSFSNIPATYDDATFAWASLNGIGVSYVDTSNPNLYVITVSFCWQQKNGLIVGEDTNLNGVLNPGEDSNGNGMIDSPVQIVTAIYNG
jgi:prepilin-type N-terminal cleavage/methylation domain-containing protein